MTVYAGCLPSSFSGAIPVQKGLKSIESIENIEFEARIYGGILTYYPCIWGMGLNFESVGCAFESHRGYLTRPIPNGFHHRLSSFSKWFASTKEAN